MGCQLAMDKLLVGKKWSMSGLCSDHELLWYSQGVGGTSSLNFGWAVSGPWVGSKWAMGGLQVGHGWAASRT